MSLYAEFDHHDLPVGDDGTPHEFYRALRDEALELDTPIGWTERHGGFWVATGYDVARQILLDNETFTNEDVVIPRYNMPDGRKFILTEMDEPIHKKYRALVNRPFSPGNAEALGESMRAVANDLIDGFIKDPKVEICEAYTSKLPGIFTAIMLGCPPEDGLLFREWAHMIAHGAPTGDDAAASQLQDIDGYFREMLESRRANLSDDLISLVIQSEVDGEKLKDHDIKDFWVVLMLAGIDNTSRLVSNMLWRLSWDEELRTQLTADLALLPFAFDECMRAHSTAFVGRCVAKDAAIGGVNMKRGQKVVLAVPIINRDPRQFADPDVFIPDRSPNRHVSLGLGIHRCLGIHLVRVETKVATQAFLERMPTFGPDVNRPAVWSQGTVCGITQLPLVFGAPTVDLETVGAH